jgi:hypothetical protein
MDDAMGVPMRKENRKEKENRIEGNTLLPHPPHAAPGTPCMAEWRRRNEEGDVIFLKIKIKTLDGAMHHGVLCGMS